MTYEKYCTQLLLQNWHLISKQLYGCIPCMYYYTCLCKLRITVGVLAIVSNQLQTDFHSTSHCLCWKSFGKCDVNSETILKSNQKLSLIAINFLENCQATFVNRCFLALWPFVTCPHTEPNKCAWSLFCQFILIVLFAPQSSPATTEV